MHAWLKQEIILHFFSAENLHLVEFNSETQVGKARILESISASMFQLQARTHFPLVTTGHSVEGTSIKRL